MLDEIILIDDDKITTKINSKIIRSLFPDIEIKTFENGEKGIAYMIMAKDEERKTLVIVDINMPVMNGFEFLSIFENSLAYQDHNFVICLLTSSLDEKDYKKAKKYPSVLEYTTKPLSKEKVQDLVERASTQFPA